MSATGKGRARGRASIKSDIAVAMAPGGLVNKTESGSQQQKEDDDRTNMKQASSPTSPSKSVESATLSVEDIETILKDSRTYSDHYNLKKVLLLAQNFVRTDRDVKTVACAIYQKCMDDCSVAKRGAEICDRLTSIEVGEVKFRNCLLSLVQADYKIRREMLASSPSHFNGFLAFLCEIFNTMRTATGEVFKPLIGPIFDCLEMVVGLNREEKKKEEDQEEDDYEDDDDLVQAACELDEDSCDILKVQLQEVGKLLERENEKRMRRLVNRVRTCIIHSTSSPRVRCSLLEVVEAYSRSWETAPNDTTKYYLDMDVNIISGLVL